VRLGVVFAIYAVLSAIVVFFGSLTVFRLTGVASFLVPLCLAVFRLRRRNRGREAAGWLAGVR